jgi:hypothetical protein
VYKVFKENKVLQVRTVLMEQMDKTELLDRMDIVL